MLCLKNLNSISQLYDSPSLSSQDSPPVPNVKAAGVDDSHGRCLWLQFLALDFEHWWSDERGAVLRRIDRGPHQ